MNPVAWIPARSSALVTSKTKGMLSTCVSSCVRPRKTCCDQSVVDGVIVCSPFIAQNSERKLRHDPTSAFCASLPSVLARPLQIACP